jgi:3-oxoacyl-[acyl-carrier protein] reductase
MNLELFDRVAFVAGSSRGIGKSIAVALLREGCRVCITGRDASVLDATVHDMRTNYGDKVFGISGDFAESSVINSALSALNRAWGGPDIVIANLGSGRGKPGWEQEEDEWERLFDLNFFASVRLAQASIPYMQAHGGSLLFIASIVAVDATPAPLPYSAAKAALVNYSKNLSRIIAADGIRVNCLAPGNVLFPGGSWEQHLKNRREEVGRFIATDVPQKRFGTPEEIADFAAFLVSPLAGFATGGCYIMDGGQTRKI